MNHMTSGRTQQFVISVKTPQKKCSQEDDLQKKKELTSRSLKKLESVKDNNVTY